MVTFHGERLHGRYVLFRTRGDDWMIHRMDPPEDPDREPMPERLAPMLARTGTLPARHGRVGVRDQVGRRARDRLRRRRPAAAREPQRQRHHAPLPGAARARPGARLARRDPRRRGGGVRGRPPLVPEAPGPDAPDLGAHGAPARAVRPGHLHDLRRALARGALAAGPDLRGAAGEAGRARAERPDLADAGATTSATARACSRLRAPRGSRASSPSGSTAPTRPGAARTAGSRSRTSAAPTPSSAAGCPARRGARAASARSWSASTRTASCATRAASAAASPRRSSRALGKLLDGLARDDSPFSGRQPPKETRFVEPRLVCVVDYSEVTQAKTLRQPSYKGLRDDIAPEDVGSPDPV